MLNQGVPKGHNIALRDAYIRVDKNFNVGARKNLVSAWLILFRQLHWVLSERTDTIFNDIFQIKMLCYYIFIYILHL